MKRVPSRLLAAIVCLGAFAFLEGAAMAARTATVCPPVGNDTDCGTIITITDSGQGPSAAVTSTGQPPYDAIVSPPGEDTLPDPSPYYAVNPANPSAPVHLTSASVAFIDPIENGYTYKPAWNSFPYIWDPIDTTHPWSLVLHDNGTTACPVAVAKIAVGKRPPPEAVLPLRPTWPAF